VGYLEVLRHKLAKDLDHNPIIERVFMYHEYLLVCKSNRIISQTSFIPISINSSIFSMVLTASKSS